MAKSFYNIIFTITVVIAILALAIMGLAMILGRETDIWPPDLSECPDYWVVNSDGTCSPRAGVGNTGSASNVTVGGTQYTCGKFDPTHCGTVGGASCTYKNLMSSNTSGTGQLAAGSPRCVRKNWASACGVYWDGISDISPMYCGDSGGAGGLVIAATPSPSGCDCTKCAGLIS